MQQSRLFTLLPEYVSTPDGMAIDNEGNLILACPSYADPTLPGCILKIDENKRIRKWVDVPVSMETGHAFPMGIAKDTGPYNFNLFMHQWPTRTAEAAAQEPLIEWVRAGKLSHRDCLSAELPVKQAARALEASQQPTSIKTLLRL
jgi:hypothetical protein